jgi:hypothetical protein
LNLLPLFLDWAVAVTAAQIQYHFLPDLEEVNSGLNENLQQK